MSNIEEFPGRDELSPRQKLRKQFFKRLRARMYTIILIVILVAAAVFGYLAYERNKVYSGVEVVESVSFSPASGPRVEEFSGSVLTYSKDGAQVTDAKWNLLWNRTFDMQNPMVSICEDTVAFADYGGSTVYVQTAGGEAYEISTAMPIRKISASNKGIVTAVLEDVGVTWIYLYDSNGDIVAKIRTTMEKSGYPVNLDMAPTGKVLGISYYHLDIGDAMSSVAFYNFGEVGQNSIDNYVSGYNYQDSLVPLVKFLSGSHAFALSGTRLTIYEGSEKPISLKEIFIDDEILSVFNNSEYIGIVVRSDDNKSAYKLRIYSDKGILISEKGFDFDYSGVVFSEGQYALYGNTDIYVGTVDGREKFSYEYEMPIRLMIPTSSPTKYIIVTESSIDTVLLR